MWNKENEEGCRCHGMCETCHEGAPKTKEEKLAFLTAKEGKLKEKLEKIGKIKEKVAAK